MFNPYLLNLSADKKKIFGYLLLVCLILFVGSQFLIAGDYESIYAFICLNVITVRLVLELIFNMAKIWNYQRILNDIYIMNISFVNIVFL